MAATTTYGIYRYVDGERIGSIDLTTDQWRRVEGMTQQPEGLVRLGDLPRDLYELDIEYQDTSADTTVYYQE